jgi:hypothetical protein
VSVWIFVATRSVANLSERPRMHASVPKIKNGAHYQPQLMTEQSDGSAGSVARPPRQEQRATAKVIRLLPQVGCDLRIGYVGRTATHKRNSRCKADTGLGPLRVEGGLSPVLVPPQATPGPTAEVRLIEMPSRLLSFVIRVVGPVF